MVMVPEDLTLAIVSLDWAKQLITKVPAIAINKKRFFIFSPIN
jgi:hypothetical protein